MTSCECVWKNCGHKGRTVPAADHGDVVTSPPLCMACLFVCCGEEDDEMDSEASGVTAVPAQDRHSLPHQETGEAHHEGDGCPGETAAIPDAAVEAAAAALLANALDESRDGILPQPDHFATRARVALAAAFPLLLAELRATEADLGVAVQVAAERADEAKKSRDAIDAYVTANGQLHSELRELRDGNERLLRERQSVLDLCYDAEQSRLFPLTVDAIRSALGDGAATGTKGGPECE